MGASFFPLQLVLFTQIKLPYLAARLTRILPLLQLLMTLFVRLVVAPEGEGFGAEGAGDGALVAGAFHVVVGGHLGARHPAQVTSVLGKLI